MPSTNPTHRKRLAREYATRTGLGYMAALAVVTEAADAGRLPSRLDDAGIAAALRILTDPPTASASRRPAAPAAHVDANAPIRRQVSDVRDQPVWDASYEYEVLTGNQGLLYISSPGSGADRYVFGAGHVALGRREALDHITTLLAQARAAAARPAD